MNETKSEKGRGRKEEKSLVSGVGGSNRRGNTYGADPLIGIVRLYAARRDIEPGSVVFSMIDPLQMCASFSKLEVNMNLTLQRAAVTWMFILSRSTTAPNTNPFQCLQVVYTFTKYPSKQTSGLGALKMDKV